MNFIRRPSKQFLKLLGLLITVSFVPAFTSTSAQAEVSPSFRQGFCSVTARDGNWAFSFAHHSPYAACRTAERALRAITYAPISYPIRGYYSAHGYNRVQVRCYLYSRSFVGYGVRPLQDAYDNAVFSRASDCRFDVTRL